jgi:hypothetical protein
MPALCRRDRMSRKLRRRMDFSTGDGPVFAIFPVSADPSPDERRSGTIRDRRTPLSVQICPLRWCVSPRSRQSKVSSFAAAVAMERTDPRKRLCRLAAQGLAEPPLQCCPSRNWALIARGCDQIEARIWRCRRRRPCLSAPGLCRSAPATDVPGRRRPETTGAMRSAQGRRARWRREATMRLRAKAPPFARLFHRKFLTAIRVRLGYDRGMGDGRDAKSGQFAAGNKSPQDAR